MVALNSPSMQSHQHLSDGTPPALFRYICAVLIASALLCPYVQAQESYPMLCRGGGVMRYEISPRQDGQVLQIYFAKGTQAAGVAAIPLGTCTWTDRGIRSEEPNVILVKQLGAYIDAKLGADGRVYEVAAKPFRNDDHGRRAARQLNYLLDAVRTGRNFQVEAYQYASGGMTGFSVTKIGP